MTKALIMIGFISFALNACVFALIWIVAQFRPEINITTLYQVEKITSYWFFGCATFSALSSLAIHNLSRQIIKVGTVKDFFGKDINQNGKWLFWVAGTFVISEIIQNLLGHPAIQVIFSDGSWVAHKARFHNISVTEALALDLMWNSCRFMSGALVFVASSSAFLMCSFIKLIRLMVQDIV